MKVLAISGSPRKGGNSETVIRKIIEKLEDKQYETEFVQLNDLVLKGCQACRYCRTNGDKCILKDDISELLEKMKKADRIIIGAPNYMGCVSGQLKILMDRMYSLKDSGRNSRLNAGKKVVLVFSQGHSDPEAYSECYENVKKRIESLNVEITSSIIAHSVEVPGEVKEKSEIMRMAEKAAETL